MKIPKVGQRIRAHRMLFSESKISGKFFHEGVIYSINQEMGANHICVYFTIDKARRHDSIPPQKSWIYGSPGCAIISYGELINAEIIDDKINIPFYPTNAGLFTNVPN